VGEVAVRRVGEVWALPEARIARGAFPEEIVLITGLPDAGWHPGLNLLTGAYTELHEAHLTEPNVRLA
jgi:hypothetical protein